MFETATYNKTKIKNNIFKQFYLETEMQAQKAYGYM